MNSYVVKVYAENLVGFTNTVNHFKLHQEITGINAIKEIYENQIIDRVVRPRTIPSLITEERSG